MAEVNRHRLTLVDSILEKAESMHIIRPPIERKFNMPLTGVPTTWIEHSFGDELKRRRDDWAELSRLLITLRDTLKGSLA
jgi:hypothetical protein